MEKSKGENDLKRDGEVIFFWRKEGRFRELMCNATKIYNKIQI